MFAGGIRARSHGVLEHIISKLAHPLAYPTECFTFIFFISTYPLLPKKFCHTYPIFTHVFAVSSFTLYNRTILQ